MGLSASRIEQVFAGLLLTVLITLPRVGWCCDCAKESATELLKTAKTILVVKAKSATSAIKLDVEKTYRGKAPKEISLVPMTVTDCNRPSSEYKNNETYLWMSDYSEQDLQKPVDIQLCSYFEPTSSVGKEMKWLNEHPGEIAAEKRSDATADHPGKLGHKRNGAPALLRKQ